MNDVLNRFRTWDGFSFGNVALTDRGQLLKGRAPAGGKKTKREQEIEKGRMKKAGNPIEAAAAKEAKAQGMPGYKSEEKDDRPMLKSSPFRETGDDWFNKAAVTDTGVLVDASGIIEENLRADVLEKAAAAEEALIKALADELPLLKNDDEAGEAVASMAAKIKKGNPKLSDEDAKKMAEKAVAMRKKKDGDDKGEDTEKSNGDAAAGDEGGDDDKPKKPEPTEHEKAVRAEEAKGGKPSEAKPPASGAGMGT